MGSGKSPVSPAASTSDPTARTARPRVSRGVAPTGRAGLNQGGAALDATPLALIVDLVRSGAAHTRPELVAAIGLGRKAVTQRVEQAIDLGLLREEGLAPSEGGRQARTLQLNAGAGHVFGVVIGASELRLAVADLGGSLLATVQEDWSIEAGPEPTLGRVHDHLGRLAKRHGFTSPWSIAVGVPGPVEFESGRLNAPPTMPGWDGFGVRAWFRDHYDAPVWVDNDANLMALGEWTRGAHADGRDMLFVKVGTGVGAGLVVRGRVLRGERGGAGDIGHLHVSEDPTRICRCGKQGCLEASASGWSLLAEATARQSESVALGAAIKTRGMLALGDIGRATVEGDPLALELVDNAARTIGEIVANLVNFTNPGAVVIGGGVLRTGTRFVDSVADVVRRRVTDFAGEDLSIRPATLDQLEGVTGAALLAVENVLSPPSLAHWIETGSPLGHAVALQQLSAALD